MVVIADTSPLNYLIQIGAAAILESLYGQVVIPHAVLLELQDEDAPKAVAEWAAQLPSWVEVRPTRFLPDDGLDELGAGERAAITLACQYHSPVLLLMDDREARAEADHRQLRTIGTLGLLRDAAVAGLVDLPAAFARLQKTSFYAPHALMAELLAAEAARRDKQ